MISIKTQYTLPSYRKFVLFSVCKGKYYLAYQALLFICFPVAAIALLFLTNFDIFCIYFALLLALYFLRIFIAPNRTYKRSPMIFQSQHCFTFDDEKITVTSQSTMSSGNGDFQYHLLFKVYETKDSFYLYISPRQAYLLNKKDFIEGTPMECRALLRAHMDEKKFIVCWKA